MSALTFWNPVADFCCSRPYAYQSRGTAYSGVAPSRSMAASTYGRNAYVWIGCKSNALLHFCHFAVCQCVCFYTAVQVVAHNPSRVFWWTYCTYSHNIKGILCKNAALKLQWGRCKNCIKSLVTSILCDLNDHIYVPPNNFITIYNI